MQLTRALPLLLILLVLQSCSTTPPDPTELIIGDWQSRIGGFNVTTSYSDSRVSVDGHTPLDYQLEGNQLTIDGDETTRRTVDFLSRSIMIQTDIITGTEHRFERTAKPG